MDQGPGALLRPVGPLPAAVYWRRRALVVVVPLALLLLLRACGGGEEEPFSLTPSPTPSATRTATPTPAATRPPATAACPDSALEVAVAAQPETSPTSFVVTVTNRGRAPCRRDLGPTAVQVVVTSGADRIWARQDCDRRTAREVATLAPGASRAVRVAWDGRRSKPACAGSRAEAAPGTYRVTGAVGSRALPTAVFRVR